ncbi:MAG: tetratricopeptide repeat protein [Candidatus Peribacteria bacterium]|nr:tetratricopeptide repeat protein [Candidatus Peribacteria bacterium]
MDNYEKAYDLFPSDESTKYNLQLSYFNLADSYVTKKQYDNAIRYFNKALNLYPRNAIINLAM